MTRFPVFSLLLAILSGCIGTNTPFPNEINVTSKVLDLNDPKWKRYGTRSGNGDDLAARLRTSPKNDEQYFLIFHECCDLGTFEIYPAAYAAFPHLEKLASESTDPKDFQWPLSICAAICANFKTSHSRSEVPHELWDNFIAAVNRSAQTATEKIQKFPADDPSFMKFMMIQPVLQNIETKPLFGNPQPNSFVLYDWFEERRPKEMAK